MAACFFSFVPSFHKYLFPVTPRSFFKCYLLSLWTNVKIILHVIRKAFTLELKSSVYRYPCSVSIAPIGIIRLNERNDLLLCIHRHTTQGSLTGIPCRSALQYVLRDLSDFFFSSLSFFETELNYPHLFAWSPHSPLCFFEDIPECLSPAALPLSNCLWRRCIIMMLSSSLDQEDHDRASNNRYVKRFLNKPLGIDKFTELMS